MAESVLRFRVETKDANAKINRLKQQVQKLEVAVKGAGGSTKVAGAGFKAFGSGAQAAAVGARGLGAALSTALGPLTAVVAAAASLGQVFGVLRQQDFAEAKVRSLGVNSKELTARLKDVSGELSGQASVLDLTGAAYDVASAGFNNAADASKILKAASQGATGGFSDINTVGDAATSVLNAYGLEADKAGKLVDGFIQTQNDGKIVIGEYAANIAKVAPVAAALGVPLEEVNAAVAQITAGGQGAEVTFTALKTAFAQVAAGKVGKEFEALGVEINASTLKSDGLAGTLEKIKKSGADAGTVIKAFGTEAGPSILALLNDTEKYNQLLEKQKQSQGAAAKAAFTASDTIDGQLKRLTTAFQNLFSDQSELGIIIKQTFKVAAVTVEALGVALNVLLAPGRAIMAAFEEIGGAIAEAIGVDAKDAAFNLEQGFQNIVKGINNAVKIFVNFGRVVGKIIGGLIAINIKFQQEVIGAYQKFAERVIGFFTRIFETGKQKFTDLKDGIISTITGFINTGIQKFTEFREFITTALSSPAKEASSVFARLAKFMQGIFQRIGSFASGFFTGFTDSAQATAERVTQFFGGLFNGLVGIINRFIDGLPDWLKNALGGVGDLAGDIAGAIGNALRGIRDLAVNVPGQITAAFGPGTSGDNQQGQAASDLATANTITSTGGKLSKADKDKKAAQDKEAKRLQRIAEQHEKTKLQIEEQIFLASAVNDEERKRFERVVQIQRILRNKKGLSDEQLQVELNLTHELHKQQDQTEAIRDAAKKRAEEAKKAADEEKRKAEQIKNLYQGIGDTIQNGIVDALNAGIEGFVAGTKKLDEALKDIASGVLKDIGQQLIKFGLNTFFNSLGGGGTGGLGGLLGRLFKADGGPVDQGSPYIVGERGPELFVPGQSGQVVSNDNMRAAMGRYQRSAGLAGGVSQGSAADGTGGGAAVAAAPIDVRYTVERINSVDYVTADQFQAGMREAATQGAKQGEQRALTTLRQNTTQRKRVGLQ